VSGRRFSCPRIFGYLIHTHPISLEIIGDKKVFVKIP
jgi:hypothetical protein